MGWFDFLMRQVAGRAQARADLVNVGALGGIRDLPDLLPLLPPIDAFGETASEAALRILARATAAQLEAWDAYSRAARVDSRWARLGPEAIEESRDQGTIALAAFHPVEAVRAAAVKRLEHTEGELAARLVALRAAAA